MTRKPEDSVDVIGAIQDYSKQASEIVRQLSLAGIAIIWLFKVTEKTGEMHIEGALIPATLAIVIALTCDFLQYFYGACAWAMFNRYHERRGTVPDTAPSWINTPTFVLFLSKSLAIVVGYAMLVIYLASHVMPE